MVIVRKIFYLFRTMQQSTQATYLPVKTITTSCIA